MDTAILPPILANSGTHVRNAQFDNSESGYFYFTSFNCFIKFQTFLLSLDRIVIFQAKYKVPKYDKVLNIS